MSRAPALEPEAKEAARAALRRRLPHFAGCPAYLTETADIVVQAYLSEATPDLFAVGRPARRRQKRA